mmetsp:Transcript_32537/g.56693  ORF Transcript_32537/g.56693 Transcript_32537/m.56693 type:complete len:130 (+) Transcript_32537:2-391(+)
MDEMQSGLSTRVFTALEQQRDEMKETTDEIQSKLSRRVSTLLQEVGELTKAREMHLQEASQLKDTISQLEKQSKTQEAVTVPNRRRVSEDDSSLPNSICLKSMSSFDAWETKFENSALGDLLVRVLAER